MESYSVNHIIETVEDFDSLMDLVENGHPSIDKQHPAYKPLRQLGRMKLENMIKKYETIRGEKVVIEWC